MPKFVPVDVATRETLEFLTSHLSVRATILEVGCGDGRVASRLLKQGYRVTGLDSKSDMIAKAARGVPTVVASWPKFDPNVAFDAIAALTVHDCEMLVAVTLRATAESSGLKSSGYFFSNFTITTISRTIKRTPTILQIHIIHIGHIIMISHLRSPDSETLGRA
jgi:SAM-dependent methyltransferase